MVFAWRVEGIKMITIQSSSMEAKILQYLLNKYPVTAEELKDMLSLPGKKVDLVLARLRKRGIVEFELLPDKRYIRLVRSDIRFEGVNPSQKQAIKKRKSRKKRSKESDDQIDVMYA